MRALTAFSLVLTPCLYLVSCQTSSGINGTPHITETQQQVDGGERRRALLPDVWTELRKLQETMVEMKLELEHMTEWVRAADGKMEALQVENSVLKTRVTMAEKRVAEVQTENEVQAEEHDAFQQTLSTLQEKVTVGKGLIEEQSVMLQELRNTNKVRKVAFSTSLLSSGEGNTRHPEYANLIFRNIFTNIGNHYNSITGYFTAPVRGVYYFRFTVHVAHTDKTLALRLLKNGEPVILIGERPTTEPDLEESASNGAVLQLDVGDVVSLDMYGEVWDDQHHRTTFSGFLLFAN